MVGFDCQGSVGIQAEGLLCLRAGSWEAASEFLTPVSINRKELPEDPASVFLKHIGRNWPNPD